MRELKTKIYDYCIRGFLTKSKIAKLLNSHPYKVGEFENDSYQNQHIITAGVFLKNKTYDSLCPLSTSVFGLGTSCGSKNWK